MSILGLVLYSGSLNLEKMIEWQANHGWFILYQPLAFLLFMTAVFAECNRLPFDLPEAEQELVGGYHTEYSSFKFAMFFLGEYIHMITTSFLMAILFFGGWHFPGIGRLDGIVGHHLEVRRRGRESRRLHHALYAGPLDDPAISLRSVDGPGLESDDSSGDREPALRDDRPRIRPIALGADIDIVRAVLRRCLDWNARATSKIYGTKALSLAAKG